MYNTINARVQDKRVRKKIFFRLDTAVRLSYNCDIEQHGVDEMLTERKAGQIANQIHAARTAKQLTLRQALAALERIQHCLSTLQFTKLMDLQDHARYNPHLLDQ